MTTKTKGSDHWSNATGRVPAQPPPPNGAGEDPLLAELTQEFQRKRQVVRDELRRAAEKLAGGGSVKIESIAAQLTEVGITPEAFTRAVQQMREHAKLEKQTGDEAQLHAELRAAMDAKRDYEEELRRRRLEETQRLEELERARAAAQHKKDGNLNARRDQATLMRKIDELFDPEGTSTRVQREARAGEVRSSLVQNQQERERFEAMARNGQFYDDEFDAIPDGRLRAQKHARKELERLAAERATLEQELADLGAAPVEVLR